MARVRFLDQVPVGFYEQNAGGGGNGVPGSPYGSIQYNNAGAFAGSSNLIWNNATSTLTIIGTLNATSFTGSLYGTSSWAASSSYSILSTTSSVTQKIQSGSIIGFVNNNIFYITSGSNNIFYISGSNGNTWVSGSITSKELYTTTTNTTELYTSNAQVSSLLSFDSMTSVKSYVDITPSTTKDLITYPISLYFGVAIDGVAYATDGTYNNNTLLFRLSIANNGTTAGQSNIEILSSTDNDFSVDFIRNLVFSPIVGGGNVKVSVTNNSSYTLKIRPMYRLVKQCLTP